jgi:hypothetical protein
MHKYIKIKKDFNSRYSNNKVVKNKKEQLTKEPPHSPWLLPHRRANKIIRI